MKESIQNSGQEVSVVIYDSPLPPRYLRFSKKFIRTLFVVVPLLLGLIFMSLLALGLGYKVKDTPAPTLPVVVSDEDSKIQALEAELNSLRESQKLLQDKIASQGSSAPVAGQEEPYLMGIKKPYGMQNLLSENKVSLDQFEFVPDREKTNLKFQIISNDTDNRVTGHVLVFMVSDNGLISYPAAANSSLGAGVKYSLGEPFAVSRLRPTNAEFAGVPAGPSVKFLIYIFSREGDLLLIKETESYKLGGK